MPALESDRIVAALRGAFARRKAARTAPDRADKIQAAGPPYTRSNSNAARKRASARGACRGDTDHTRSRGVGVCGTAVALGKDQTCPMFAQSELPRVQQLDSFRAGGAIGAGA